MLFGFLIVIVMVSQNMELKRRLGLCVTEKSKIEDQLRLATSLQRLVGARIPFHEKVRVSLGGRPVGERGCVVVVFNPTACGRNIRSQLTVLKSFQENSGGAPMEFIALIGLETEQDREWALTLREQNLISFPFAYDRSESLALGFPLQWESGFTDSPLYFLIDSDLRVQAAFKPDSQNPRELHAWLASLIKA